MNSQATRIVARAWIQGKAWAGKGENRDEARSKLIKYLKVPVLHFCSEYEYLSPNMVVPTPYIQDHVKRTMEKGLYTLEDGELIPEPTLSDKGKVKTAVFCSSLLWL